MFPFSPNKMPKNWSENNQPDVVETLAISLYNQIPKPVKEFKDEYNYIMTYSTEHNLNSWWTAKHIAESFVRTGCAQWTTKFVWPYLVSAKENYLDGLAICFQPTAFLGGYTVGLFLDRETSRHAEILYTLKTKGSIIVDKFDMKLHLAPNLLHISAATLGFYIVPKLVDKLTTAIGSDDEISIKSIFAMLLKACSMLLGASVGFSQGWYSHLRCQRQLTESQKSQKSLQKSYQENRDNIVQMLPLLPIRITDRTVDKTVASLPHLVRTWNVVMHMYPLRNKMSNSLHSFAFTIVGFGTWIKYYHKDFVINVNKEKM